MLPKLNNAPQHEKGGVLFVCFCFLDFYQGLKLLENFGVMGMELQLLYGFFLLIKKYMQHYSILFHCWQIFDYIITICKYFCTLPFYNKVSSLCSHIGQQATFHSVEVTSK